MDCGISFIKYLLFIFNFIFTLCGLALLIVGIIIHLKSSELAKVIEPDQYSAAPIIGLIIVGAIIFTIAFFGCCGAIRESHCMIVTFAVLLLTILVIQIAVAIYIFVGVKSYGDDIVKGPYSQVFRGYYGKEDDRQIIDFVQSTFDCCGVEGPSDYNQFANTTRPWSCCKDADEDHHSACKPSDINTGGCVPALREFLKWAGNALGGIAIGIAVVEFVGIIFALCLANSIRNADRRGYRV